MLFVLLKQLLNEDIMKPVRNRYWYQIAEIVRGHQYTIKTTYRPNQLFIVNSNKLQRSPPFWCRFSYSYAYTFNVSFVCSFAILGRSLKFKKGVLVNVLQFRNPFGIGRLTFLIYLKMITLMSTFSLTHKCTNSAFCCSWILSSIVSSFFRISFLIKPTLRRHLSEF